MDTVSILLQNNFTRYNCSNQQESQRAYGTAVSKVVIHFNYIHLNYSEILAIHLCIQVYVQEQWSIKINLKKPGKRSVQKNLNWKNKTRKTGFFFILAFLVGYIIQRMT